MNGTLFGNRVFADVIILGFRDYPGSGWPYVFTRDRRGETQTQRGSREKTEAEMGGMRPQAQGRLEPPEAGRGGKDPPLEPLEGAQP